MLVHEVMTAPAITVTPRTSVQEALRLLDGYDITALPVVDGRGDVVGVVSEADLVREAVLPDGRAHMVPVHLSEQSPGRCVADVMTSCPLTISSRSDLADAVELMTSTAVKSLPVVDMGRLVGVVSRRDVVRVLAREDDRIRAEVDELFRSEGADWLVEVDDGVVDVTGPADAHERRIAEVLAACVSGVVAVRIA